MPRGRIELPASSLPMMRSTTELPRHCRNGKRALAYAGRHEKTVLPRKAPHMTDKPNEQEKAARRAEALRANLRRRKAATRKEKAPSATKPDSGEKG